MVDNDGIVKWQIESEDMYGINKVSVTDENLLIERYDESLQLTRR